MDCTSPGNVPVAFGNVCGGGVVNGAYGTTACIIEPFGVPWNPSPFWPQPHSPTPLGPLGPVPDQHTHYHFASVPVKLSDEDVERIARRVVELMREARP